MALTQVKTSGIADDAVTQDKVANDAIDITEIKSGTDGELITYDASGNPAKVDAGTAGHFLKSQGAGNVPVFAAVPAGGATINNATENEIVTVASTTSQLDAEAKFTYDGNTAVLQTTSDGNAINVVRNSADANPVNITLTKSRNATYGSYTVVNNSDQIGEIVWKADDGTDYASEAGAIRVDIDGAPGGNDMPGRMEFFTGADSSGTAAKRLTLQASGNVYIEDGDLVVNSGHGVDFSLTADAPGTSASSSSELFANYEKGTWTPAMSSGTVSPANAIYIRVGDLVWCQAQLGSISERSSSNEFRVTPASLPFAMDGQFVAAGPVRHRYTSHAGGYSLVAIMDGNGIYFGSSNDATGDKAYTALLYSQIDASYSEIVFSVLYRTDSA